MDNKGKKVEDVKDFIRFFIVALILVIVCRIFVFELVLVSGNSMYPNLKDGNRLVLSKISYIIKDVEKNDVIVFNANKKEKYIKRVIGTSGDNIYVKDDILYVNNMKVDEYYLDKVYVKDKMKKDNLYHFTNDFDIEELEGKHKKIPEGYVFVMGDNRPDSNDSRSIGIINKSDIVGKIVFKKF